MEDTYESMTNSIGGYMCYREQEMWEWDKLMEKKGKFKRSCVGFTL